MQCEMSPFHGPDHILITSWNKRVAQESHTPFIPFQRLPKKVPAAATLCLKVAFFDHPENPVCGINDRKSLPMACYLKAYSVGILSV